MRGRAVWWGGAAAPRKLESLRGNDDSSRRAVKIGLPRRETEPCAGRAALPSLAFFLTYSAVKGHVVFPWFSVRLFSAVTKCVCEQLFMCLISEHLLLMGCSLVIDASCPKLPSPDLSNPKRIQASVGDF